MSEAGGPRLDPLEERFSRAKDLFDRDMIDDAIEQLIPLANDKVWHDRARELAGLISIRAALTSRLSPRLRHLLALLKLPPPLLSDSYSIPDSDDREVVGQFSRRGGSTWPGQTDGPLERSDELEVVDVGQSTRTIERTPHLTIDSQGSLSAGKRFSVTVFLDKSASAAGEAAEAVRAAADSRVQMSLGASGHFIVDGLATLTFVLDASVDHIDVGSFMVRVVDKPGEIEGSAFLAAIFYVDGRPCGRVARNVEIEGVNHPKPDEHEGRDTATAEPMQNPVVVIPPTGAEPADITVTIVAAEINDGRSFVCSVETGHRAVAGERKTAAWNLTSATRGLVSGFMKRFTTQKAGSRELIAELRGAGNVLFEASPRIFRDTFWSLVDAGIQIRTIAIVTAEPFVPWELMIPNRWKDGQYEERPPIGVEFQVARWTSEEVVSPARTIALRDCFVIAPSYPGKKQLRNSDAEATMVLGKFHGDRISPADFSTIEAKLGGEARTLVHFICHGDDDENGIQSILLEGGVALSSHALLGMSGLAKLFRTKRPLVFLNACKVGQTLPSLVGLGGFVVSFIKLGATAVIAPLWSVEDEVAIDIATQFYDRLTSGPKVPLSRIFSDIRARAYEDGSGRDTYAAYCFYGDPFASLE